jgi:hypothetical protein
MEATDNRGLAPLAGICSYEDAQRPGLSVERTVGLLKTYYRVASWLVDFFTAHLARTPEWEAKCAFSLHAWLGAELADGIRRRVPEMRQPPPKLDVPASPGIERWLDEAIRAGGSAEVLTSAYACVIPELARSFRRHLADANPLADYPTCRLLRGALADVDAMTAWGDTALAAVGAAPDWRAHLDTLAAAAGGIYGDLEGDTPAGPLRADGSPYEMDARPARDDRFIEPFNRSALIDTIYRDAGRGAEERILALVCKRLREMDVPEWLAPVIHKTRGKPWEYYLDLTRQLWDEARHAMMGEVALHARGIPFYRYPVDMTASAVLNESLPPLDAHVILWGIEQGLMRADGKRAEHEMVPPQLDALQKVFQDFDWADEVLHAQIGRRWLAPELGGVDGMNRRYEEIAKLPWGEMTGRLTAGCSQEPWWPRLLADALGIEMQRQE